MGYNSSRPHQVPLLSAKNRNLRLQCKQVHQNWTGEDEKNVAWSDESGFLLRQQVVGSESGVDITGTWTRPANGPGYWCCNVWGMFSLIPITHDLNATAHLSIDADCSTALHCLYMQLPCLTEQLLVSLIEASRLA